MSSKALWVNANATDYVAGTYSGTDSQTNSVPLKAPFDFGNGTSAVGPGPTVGGCSSQSGDAFIQVRNNGTNLAFDLWPKMYDPSKPLCAVVKFVWNPLTNDCG